MGQAVVRFKQEYRNKIIKDEVEKIVSIPYHNINYLYYEIDEQEVNNNL